MIRRDPCHSVATMSCMQMAFMSSVSQVAGHLCRLDFTTRNTEHLESRASRM